MGRSAYVDDERLATACIVAWWVAPSMHRCAIRCDALEPEGQ